MDTAKWNNTISDTVLKKNCWQTNFIHIQQIRASLPNELELNRLSEIADKIHENNTQENNIYAYIHHNGVTGHIATTRKNIT